METAVRIIVNLLLSFITAWLVMLFLGNASIHDGRIPDLGFWSCFWVSLAVDALVTAALVSREVSD